MRPEPLAGEGKTQPSRPPHSSQRREKTSASCRVIGNSSGTPDLVRSTRNISAFLSTRSQRSARTSLRRMPVRKPAKKASRAAGHDPEEKPTLHAALPLRPQVAISS